MRLDIHSVLTAAVAMYGGAGYRPIARYNTNPYPDLFFERRPAATFDGDADGRLR